ncbi:zinc transporter [Roseateles sp. YR242]|uniref:transporter n=1 Tax=Roseateles sp. YR242 TaxID=1855305 RepID=UPI0008B9693B|nr:transporter [Roseateles sp. YR242]SEK59909.1 zinc transporter [Roseateles sp. YR242]
MPDPVSESLPGHSPDPAPAGRPPVSLAPQVSSYGSDQQGLICGFWIHPERETQALPTLAEAQVRLEQPEGGFVWLHFNLSHSGALPWLAKHAALADSFVEAQQAGSRSSRIERDGDQLFAVLNDVTFDFAFDVGDVSTLWMQVSQHLVLSARRSPLRSVDRLRMAVKRGERPHSSLGLLDHLLRDQADELQRIVRQATERVDDIEDALLAGRRPGADSEVAQLRRLMVRLQRLLAPEPSALLRMLSNPPAWVAESDKQQLQQASEEFSLVLRDIQALQERIRAVQDETAARVAQENNRTLYLLTMVTVLALPINLISGLFGMNVGGLPFLDHPHGFVVVVSLIVVLTVVVTGLLVWAVRKPSR